MRLPTCELCGKECTENDKREFPEPHYICLPCERLAMRAARNEWRDKDPAAVALGLHLKTAPASWDPYQKAREWWRSVNRTNREDV